MEILLIILLIPLALTLGVGLVRAIFNPVFLMIIVGLLGVLGILAH
jgi:hypothetical protein